MSPSVIRLLPVLEAAWIEEARRRLHDIKAGRVEPAPWSEARDRIFARAGYATTGRVSGRS